MKAWSAINHNGYIRTLSSQHLQHTYIELSIKDDQFGACGYQVITVVCGHELCIDQLRIIV
jgi:hypothetical protein